MNSDDSTVPRSNAINRDRYRNSLPYPDVPHYKSGMEWLRVWGVVSVVVSVTMLALRMFV